jgi:predicted nucleic acid-binding protein
MTYLVDTSVLIDFLRGEPAAVDALLASRAEGSLHASEITRLEVLAGMRPKEERQTRAVLDIPTWHPVNSEIAELAGALGRAWLPSHGGIDAADLAIAATAQSLGAELLTRNVKHFPMFAGLKAPY